MSEFGDALAGYDQARLEEYFRSGKLAGVRGSPLTVIKIHDRSEKVHVLG